MGLFQKSVLKSYLSALDDTMVAVAYEEYRNFFYNPVTQQNIRNAKEEQFQEGFLRELFVNIMGYIINPNPGFNLSTEQKNVADSKKADGAIIIHDKVTGVIELKGTNTIDLGKVQQQAFYYLSAHPEAVYVITSNFEKLRFYIQKSNEYEEFNLFMLSQEEFKLLYLCISYQSISTGLPLKIKQESVVKEENITKQLYKDYSSFKQDLFRSLCEWNTEADKLTLFKASQKLIDRFLFVFFCEDNNGLLPANSISEIIKHWNKLREMDEYRPLYDIFKKYFEYINSGRSAAGDKQEIFAYNGGLFSTDTLLDQLIIEDQVLYTHTQKLSTYDFISEVDVNILGHIFEHSLNEIEEIQAELEGNPVDKSKTKRKKDGVFYTPKYITEYIVENTVGKLCTDKKTELGIDEDAFVKAKKPSDRKPLLEKLQLYKQYVLSLTICDPACGSGAFLNQAYVYLQKEHQYIADLESKLFDAPMTITDVSADILENNLYGVDINEESIEIARLALWLRSAKKGRKLNNLSNNIKCGNSLIDDPIVAGDKAFKWEEEFPQVFAKGGFDVVIGNPPYGAALSSLHKEYLITKYSTFEYQVNTYVLFYEKGLEIIKYKGILGFITPATFTYQHYFNRLRLLLQNYTQYIIVKYLFEVFDDADIGDSVTWIIQKQSNSKSNILVNVCNNIRDIGNLAVGLEYHSIVNHDSTYQISEFELTLNKFSSNLYTPLEKIANIIVGIKPYQTGKGVPKQNENDVKEKKFTNTIKVDDTYLQCVVGRDFHRYKFINEPKMYLSYGKWLAEPRESAPFFDEKIIIRQTADSLICNLDSYKRINLNNVYNIGLLDKQYSLRYLLCILNSKLLNYLYQQISQEKGRLFAEVKKVYLNKLPIKKSVLEDQLTFINHADKMIILNNNCQQKQSKFISRIQSNFQIQNISGAFEKFYEFDFKTFVEELKKQKVVLSLKDQDEWEDYFNSYKHDINTLQTEIDKTDKEIDQMVYELYGLTEEEIAVVEGNN